jgi:uncharacterized membrane protein
MNSHKELQRIEAFSDGVFAIACTLLILEIKVPHLEDAARPGALWPALQAAWPSFVAFTISFGSILVAWANHHRVLSLLVDSSKAFLFANGFLLLTITFIPFPTAVLAAHINTSQANIAVTFYSAAWALSSVGFNVWWQSMLRPRCLFSPSVPKTQLRKYSLQNAGGLVVYALTTVIAYWLPITALIIMAALFLVWVAMAIGADEPG